MTVERVGACRGQQHLDSIGLGEGEQGYLQVKAIFGYLVSVQKARVPVAGSCQASGSGFRTSSLSSE